MNKEKEILNDIRNKSNYSILGLIFLAIAVSNFMLIGVYIFISISFFYFLYKAKLIVPQSAIPIIVFSILYFYFTLFNKNISFLASLKIFVCPLLWLMAYNMSYGKNLKDFLKVTLFLSYGMALHGIFNFIYNMITNTELSFGRAYDFWAQAITTATGQAINFTLLITLIFWIFFIQKEKLLKILSLITYFLSLIYNIQLGGRTFLILSIISLIFGVITSLVYSLKNKKSFKKMLIFLFFIFALIIIGISIFERDVFGIKTFYEGSYLFKRIVTQNAVDIANDSRIAIKIKYLKLAPYYLFGGNHIKINNALGYSHELWLDIYDDAGIFAYFSIVIFCIISLVNYFNVIKNRTTSIGYKIVLINIIGILNLQFFLEPILDGAPMLFYSYIIMDGMIAAYLKNKLFLI